jgi:hypothetical protein
VKVESVQTTAFLKRIYIEMIDRYWESVVRQTHWRWATFGISHDETNLKEVARSLCSGGLLRLALPIFPKSVTEMIRLISISPDKIGIGISRGAAINVVSSGSTIAYSGRIDNEYLLWNPVVGCHKIRSLFPLHSL